MFGPVLPYRGGISQYTTQLTQALGRVAEVQTVSFKRQYPRWLYPGESDKEPSQRRLLTPGVDYLIDPMRPWTWHQAVQRVVDRGCDHAILNWWTLFCAPAYSYISWRLQKNGIPTRFLCHNMQDHGARGLRQKISNWLLSFADGYIVHSREQEDKLREMFPASPVMRRMIPIYDQFPNPSIDMPKRGRLEVLFFGFVRPYKGVDVLLDAVQRLADSDVYVTIVGEVWGDPTRLLNASDDRNVNVEVQLCYVDEQSAANYFARADIVVLPYLAATGSAVVSLAYHYRTPVLATRVGGLDDAVMDGETGWLVEPGSAEALASALAMITRSAAGDCHGSIDAFVERNNWHAMAEELCHFTIHDR